MIPVWCRYMGDESFPPCLGRENCLKCLQGELHLPIPNEEIKMSVCKKCGEEIAENGIHLFRNWPGRRESVEKVFPDAKISFCKNPPPSSFFEEKVEA